MRIADWVRPTRQVGQINGQTVTDSITHPVDTYVRPYAYRDRSLQTITEALDRWSPTFTNLAVQARDQKFKKDVAEGMALMNEFTAKGIDPLDVRMPEIREMVKNGLGGKLAQLNRAHEHGINIVQMETAAKGLQGAADDWFKNATFEKDGVQYHVYEMNDPVEFEKAFREFAAKRWFDITGGQYDARLFNEKYGPTMNEVRQNLEKQYISYKGKIKAIKAEQIFTASLDAGAVTQLRNGSYVYDADFTKKLASDMNAAYIQMMQAVDEQHALDMLANYTNALLTNATGDQIKTIEAALKMTPVWNSADKRLSIVDKMQRQEYYWEQKNSLARRDERSARVEARQQKRYQDEDYINSMIKSIHLDYNDDPARIAELKSAYPKYASYIDRTFNALKNGNSSEDLKTKQKLGRAGSLSTDEILSDSNFTDLEKRAYVEARESKKGAWLQSLRKSPLITTKVETAGWGKKNVYGVLNINRDSSARDAEVYYQQMENFALDALENAAKNNPGILNNKDEMRKLTRDVLMQFTGGIGQHPRALIRTINSSYVGASTPEMAQSYIQKFRGKAPKTIDFIINNFEAARKAFPNENIHTLPFTKLRQLWLKDHLDVDACDTELSRRNLMLEHKKQLTSVEGLYKLWLLSIANEKETSK